MKTNSRPWIWMNKGYRGDLADSDQALQLSAAREALRPPAKRYAFSRTSTGIDPKKICSFQGSQTHRQTSSFSLLLHTNPNLTPTSPLSLSCNVRTNLNPMFNPTIVTTIACAMYDNAIMLTFGAWTSTKSSQGQSHGPIVYCFRVEIIIKKAVVDFHAWPTKSPVLFVKAL